MNVLASLSKRVPILRNCLNLLKKHSTSVFPCRYGNRISILKCSNTLSKVPLSRHLQKREQTVFHEFRKVSPRSTVAGNLQHSIEQSGVNPCLDVLSQLWETYAVHLTLVFFFFFGGLLIAANPYLAVKVYPDN